jgi:hypothetical protein
LLRCGRSSSLPKRVKCRAGEKKMQVAGEHHKPLAGV